MTDINGVQVKEGDKVIGFGFIHCSFGFKIDLTPEVTCRIKDGVMYFGELSASSFDRFEIVFNSQLK